ncbi:hypothetical protein AQ505_07185 [Pedobacter sp. PACM 27299]|uniref:DUF6266 family protein n=1 Tax=Pedobacter sp. PACM 27299 TaxID=1727164 RepID=UPI0007069FA2|nr:DUF6266 family protein [Pedobacter sp. PACM 27299]ALL05294.1 hypothetical protein AQ505_07185 [Pedobacter sp. PACM 27299]
MAIAPNGPQGHLNGKVANLVFYMLNGQPVVRLIGKKGKPSTLQLANYQAMAVTTKLLRTMGNFIKLGIGLQARGTVHNAHNQATSYHKKHALKGEYPDLQIDYSKVMPSQGNMPETKGLKIIKVENGLEISWNTQQEEELASNDSFMLMICFPETERGRQYLNIARRSEGKCFIPLADKELTQQIEPYIFFISADGAMLSDSVYLGNLNGVGENLEEKKTMQRYQQVKIRFDRVASSYLNQSNENYGMPLNTKAFKYLKKNIRYSKTNSNTCQESLAKLPLSFS